MTFHSVSLRWDTENVIIFIYLLYTQCHQDAWHICGLVGDAE